MLLDKNVHVMSPNQIIIFVFVIIAFFNIKNMFYTQIYQQGLIKNGNRYEPIIPLLHRYTMYTLHLIMR